MPSGVIQSQPSPSNPNGLAFRAVYEAPWGGVNSSLYPTDIPPSDFVVADNVVIQNGVIVTVSPNCPVRPDGSYVFVLDGSIEGAYIAYVFNCNNYLCALDQFGNTYTYTNTDNTYSFVFDFANPVSTSVPYGARPVQVINNIAYIPVINTVASIYQLLVYNPGLSYVAGEPSYAVGLHLNVLSGYLLQFNVYQDSDGYAPSRVNWSAPFDYTQFNPEPVPPTRTDAGFNTLTDSAAEITGSFSLGNVGYILRTEGITQMTPTGIGIQPFDFTTLWTSKFGIGSNYSGTVAQFGNIGCFVSEADVFSFSGAIPQTISGVAKAEIYNDINSYGLTINEGIDDSFPYISGDISVYNYYNPTPAYYVNGFNAQSDIYYVLALATGIIAPATPTVTDRIIVWQYSIERQRWTRVLVPNALLLSEISGYVEDTVTSCSGKTSVVTVNYSEHLPLTPGSDLPFWEASTYYSASLCILAFNAPNPLHTGLFLYKLTTPGMSGSVEPTWDFIVGNTVSDGAAVWTCVGTAFAINVSGGTRATTWVSGADYNVGDSVFLGNTQVGGTNYPAGIVLECTQAGKAGTVYPIASGMYTTIADGSIVWTVVSNYTGFWKDTPIGIIGNGIGIISPVAPILLSDIRLIQGDNGYSQRPYENNVFLTSEYLSSGSSALTEPTFANTIGGVATETGTEPISWQAVAQLVDNTIPAMYLAPFAYINFIGTYTTNSVTAVPFSFPLVLTLGNEFNSLFQYIPPTPFTLTFKQEEFRMGRQPSVVRVVIRAQGLGTINVKVGNVNFSSINITDSTQVKTYTSSATFTGECPQLTISSTAYKGIIVKAMMVGKFSDGEFD